MWDDTKIERLKELHSQGVRIKAICNDPTIGKTKNAVIGKLHRLGLIEPDPKKLRTKIRNQRASTRQKIRRAVYAKEAAKQKAKAKPVEAEEESPFGKVEALPPPETAPPDAVKIMALKYDMCPAVYDPLDALLYCGHPKAPGSNWCKAHQAVYVRAVVPQRRAPLTRRYR